ncbi:hypothetical protein [Vibrio sp. 10N.261.55.A7]|uniref:hypothetical protein n=1 Tax=Vibrio sp. 10N.261.55.A7 TaxID=1880851 RepID=UPI000CC5164F|nr:hypothetical protein [Vibrio sp. 10N.261.55.A7]PMJ97759.1 hypothetical protein BCU12_22050 [Vibrio sp. 10N.261.55.A7]
MKYFKLISCIAIVILLAAPIVIYTKSFGIGVWSNHNDWGVMGSAIGGIYTALFAFLTLLVLIGQSSFQLRSHKYVVDMEFIRDNRSDYNELFHKLTELLVANSSAAQNDLLIIIESIPDEDILKPETFKLIRDYVTHHVQVLSIWRALQPILIGLSYNQRFPYQNSFEAIRLKTSSILGLRVCIALDKALFILDRGKSTKLYFWQKKT